MSNSIELCGRPKQLEIGPFTGVAQFIFGDFFHFSQSIQTSQKWILYAMEHAPALPVDSNNLLMTKCQYSGWVEFIITSIA